MLRRLLYFVLPYRSFATSILVVCAIVVPLWLAFRLYRQRAGGHRSSVGRELLLLVFVLYLSGLAAVTLEPNHPSREVAEATAAMVVRPDPTSLTCSGLPAGSRAHGFCVRNARGNLLLFLPLGVLLPLVVGRLGFRRGILIALGASVGIELLQYVTRAFGSYRTADVNDVILNVVGAALGLVLGFALRLGTRRRVAVARA